jgi:hypothetical protein
MKSNLRKQAPKEKKQFRILIVLFVASIAPGLRSQEATPNAVGYSNG